MSEKNQERKRIKKLHKIRDYCKDRGHCEGCKYNGKGNCKVDKKYNLNFIFGKAPPSGWELPFIPEKKKKVKINKVMEIEEIEEIAVKIKGRSLYWQEKQILKELNDMCKKIETKIDSKETIVIALYFYEKIDRNLTNYFE